MNRSKALLLTVALGAFGLMQPTSSQAQAVTETQNIIFPFDVVVYIPCAVGGEGELVELTGDLHGLFHVTDLGNGRFNVEYHYQPQGVSGTGFTTGDKYQGTGVTQGRTNLKVGVQDTYINNFRIIGQGPGNNYLVHENAHLTINANGELTSYHDNFSVECK